MDAAEAPIRGDLDQVWPFEAVRHHIVDILIEVQCILAIGKVPTAFVKREVEEILVKVKVVGAVSVVTMTIGLSVVSLTIAVIVCPLFLIG